MTRISYGPAVKQRTHNLLAALLAYVNHDWEALEPSQQPDLTFKWCNDDSPQPKLRIETTLQALQFLMKHWYKLPQRPKKYQISESLKRLEDFLEILEDNRVQTQGKEDWRFTLTLWSKDPEKNLERFEQEWERRRPKQSRTVLRDQDPELDSEAKALRDNQQGIESYWDNRRREARAKFKDALKHCDDLPEARYNLGWMYERVQDFERARLEYQEAMLGGFPPAYSNMARLCIILDKNYTAAVELIQEGLTLTQDDEIEMRYALLKNLGWARLKQSRLAEAKNALQDAILLDNERAAAHCLLAQVLDAAGQFNAAKTEWHHCLDRACNKHPDEDEWLAMAQQRLVDD